MPYKDADKQREAVRKAVHDFRVRQKEEDAQLHERFNKLLDLETLDLMEEFINEQMARGYTREQAEDQFKQSTTPPEETQPVGVATDTTPAPTPSTSELFERSQKLLEMWQTRKEMELQQINSKPMHQQSAQEKQRANYLSITIDSIKQASKSIIRPSDAEKIRVIKEFHESKEKYPGDWPESEKKTRGDEYGRPMQPTTVGDMHGLSPEERGKSPEEIREMRAKKKKDTGHE